MIVLTWRYKTMSNFKLGDEVEILISSYEFSLSAGSIGTIVDIIVDRNDNPILATIQIDNDGRRAFRNICLDHIRLPK